jgi:hypothetical protein
MLLKGYTIFSLLVAAGFAVAAINGWRLFAPAAAGGLYGGGHGSSGYHSTWHGGK